MSSINPQNINGGYPIAGQDNDSQGFRDNFTNIKNNLDYARIEINELQTNAVLKGALAGTSLNNDLNNSQIKKAQILQSTETFKDLGTLTGSISVSWQDGHYQLVTVAAGDTLAVNFTNWPTSGFWTKLRMRIVVDNSGAAPVAVTLPNTVTVNTSNIQGAVGQIVTLAANNTYEFEFTTRDGGTTVTVEDVLRNYAPTLAVTVPVTGFSTSVTGLQDRVIFNPAGTLANGTVTLPSGNVNAKIVSISSTQTITAFQVLPSAGTTLIPSANVTLTGGTHVSYYFDANTDAWLKIE